MNESRPPLNCRKVNKHNSDARRPLQEVKFLIEDPENTRNVLTYVFAFSEDDKGVEEASEEEEEEDDEEESLADDDDENNENVEVITLTPQQLFPGKSRLPENATNSLTHLFSKNWTSVPYRLSLIKKDCTTSLGCMAAVFLPTSPGEISRKQSPNRYDRVFLTRCAELCDSIDPTLLSPGEGLDVFHLLIPSLRA